jgi:thiol-disulfide isomerase/thioredoxin
MNKKFFVIFLLVALFFSGCVDPGSGEKGISSTLPDTQPIVSSTSSSTTTIASSTTTTKETTEISSTTLESTTTTTTTSTTTSTTFSPLKVEVVFFFPNYPCANCIEVGEYAEETINTYFQEEIFAGTLVFKKANYFDPQNRELVKKYGVESSSLWIGTYSEGKFYKEMKIAVWYKTGNKRDYMDYLKEAIDKRLAGELPG